MSGAQGQQGGQPVFVPPTPMTTQLHIPLGNATQPGTPGVGSNATPPGGQGNQAGQVNAGQQTTGAGNGGMSGMDLATI
jgi:hypothetical protein